MLSSSFALAAICKRSSTFIPFSSTLFYDITTLPQRSSESLLSLSDEIGKTVQFHPLNLDHYLQEEIYTRQDQIADPNNSVHDINEAHFGVMAE